MVQVTIGFAVYNGEEYLESALESLSSQTFEDMKILVSDNCSTDKTPEILAKWAKKDKRFDIHTQSENIGPVNNFQYVLNTADSKWFMFAAHDDNWTDNYVEELYKNAISKPDIKLSVPKLKLIDEDSDQDLEAGTEVPFNEKINETEHLEKYNLLLKYGKAGWFYSLYDREELLKAQAEVKNFGHVWAHDLILLLPFFISGSVVGTNKATFYQMITKSSAEKYAPKSASDRYKLYRDFCRSMISILRKSDLSKTDILKLTPSLFKYSKHGGKIRRIIKAAIMPNKN